VLRFGEFKTKAGRTSPYFFNAGLFDDGAKMARLSEFYAKAILASGMEFDMSSAPPKGIPLGCHGCGGWRARARTCPLPTTARKPRIMAKAAPWWALPAGPRAHH
jgi:hypothetical protein